MNISNNLKNFFDSKKLEGITATEIARKINISKKTLSNYINGDAYIPLKHLNAISNIFNISIDYLLGLNSNKNYQNSKTLLNLDKKLIGHRLKEWRTQNKITQVELAKLTGINKSNISKYENGKNLILTICLYSICKNYKVSADYFLGKIDYL